MQAILAAQQGPQFLVPEENRGRGWGDKRGDPPHLGHRCVRHVSARHVMGHLDYAQQVALAVPIGPVAPAQHRHAAEKVPELGRAAQGL